jgi:hypothetical protein
MKRRSHFRHRAKTRDSTDRPPVQEAEAHTVQDAKDQEKSDVSETK